MRLFVAKLKNILRNRLFLDMCQFVFLKIYFTFALNKYLLRKKMDFIA